MGYFVNGGNVVEMTRNEQLILRELSVAGMALSKRDVTHRCGMGWATAVKLMTRLEEQGYIVPSGNERQNQAGKSAIVYSLSPVKPCAIGIDIEYRRVRLTIWNLSRQCLFQSELTTPVLADPDSLVAFLESLLQRCVRRANELGVIPDGAGIGIPSRLLGIDAIPYGLVGDQLSERVGLPVLVDNNIRCFTAAIASLQNAKDSMMVVTIRSGVGVGIVVDGGIYQGDKGCAGEIGHFPVENNGLPCRCGKSGCLERIVNRDALAENLVLAVAGDRSARKRFENLARQLGHAIALGMMVLDIRRVTIFAELGEAGSMILDPVREKIGEVLAPGFDYDIGYESLDANAYVAGAARLILDHFVR